MTEPGVEIRALLPALVPAVSALAREIWQHTYPPLISQAQIDAMLAARYAPAVVRAQLDDAHHAWWTAHRADQIIGFAHACMAPPDCKLDKLYVMPAHQRRGVGRALFDSVRAWARTQGAARVWLQVNRGNTAAIAAYRRYGFVHRESRVFDIGDGFVMDDHIMETAP